MPTTTSGRAARARNYRRSRLTPSDYPPFRVDAGRAYELTITGTFPARRPPHIGGYARSVIVTQSKPATDIVARPPDRRSYRRRTLCRKRRNRKK